MPSSVRRSATLIGLLSFTLLHPANSRAQDWIGPTYEDYAQMNLSFTNTLIGNKMVEDAVRRNNGVGRGSSTAGTRRRPAATAASFAYSVTPAQRTAARDAYIADVAKRNTTLGATMRTQFTKHDYNTIYASLLSGTGLQNNNLADALAAYTVLGWMIANGQATDPPLSHIAGVRTQWVSALAGTAFTSNAASKMQTAEELKLKMVLMQAGWQDAKKTGATAAYANTVNELFKSQMKLNLRGMALSATGLKK